MDNNDVPRFIKDMVEMDVCLEIYKDRISANLSRYEKEKLHERLYDYWCREDPIRDDNPLSEFLELKKY